MAWPCLLQTLEYIVSTTLLIAIHIDYFFIEHLFITNIITAGCLLALGDFLVQTVIGYVISNRRRNQDAYDHVRTRRVLVVGMGMGVFNHLWYQHLEVLVRGDSLGTVIKKIALDQAVAGPFFSSAFIIGMGIMERRCVRDIYDEWSSKFLEIYKVDWMFWPAAQFVNFYMVSQRFRVLYVNVATLLWNTFLSYARHKDKPLSSSSSHSNRSDR